MQSLELSNTETHGNTLQVFNCELGSIRVIVDNGEPYFMASDLCQALEYKNGRDTINRLFEPSVAKYYAGVETGKKADGTPAIQNKLCTFLTEAQMYKLIMRSNAKKAEEFQDWVCGEVIPSIRKNGGYIAGQESMSELEIIANALVVANNVIQQKSKELEAIKALRAKEKPLVDFANQVASASNSISVGEFAKLLNDEQIKIGQNNLFKWLRDNGYLMKDNMPYQKYIDSGYFDVIEQTYKTPYGSKVSLKTLVTGKGQIYFTEKLRKEIK